MNQKTILILTFVVVALTITTGCTVQSNFSQVTDLDVIAAVNRSENRTPNGIIFMPILKKDKGEVLEKVLEWSNVPVPFDIEIYTIKYTYIRNNRITNHDRLVFKRTGMILNSTNSESIENIGIYVPYTDMDLSQGIGDEYYGLANVTVHLPDSRTLTATDIKTKFPPNERFNNF